LRSAAADARAWQSGWAERTPQERSRILGDLADALERHAPAIASALTIDTGRRKISGIEVQGAVQMIRRWSTIAPQVIAAAQGEERPSATPGIRVATRLHPYALVGCISPWNFPLTLALIDAIPALAAGAAVIVKPSEITPRFILPLRDAIAEVPELAGGLQLIEGDGATGAELVGLVDYVCFTGSVATGRKVGEAAARAFVPASLELGGKDPLIVLAGSDPELAAATALRASVVNSGQACQSIERILVAESLSGPFLEALTRHAEAVRLNHPDIAGGDIGPFILDRQATIAQAHIDGAVASGARLLAGGQVETLGGGLYLRPTVLADVRPDMAVWAEESFAPILPVMTYADEEEAIALANGSTFGLSAAVIGPEEAVLRLAPRLRAGAVSVNDGALTSMVWDAEKSSFGLSGLGPSRMGESGLTRFLRRQAILIQTGTPLPLTAYAEDSP
jgi:acyl-CoA reductase-like NAD-dependent aldehyde dehydrogenase